MSSYFRFTAFRNYVGSIALFAILHIQCFYPHLVPHQSIPVLGTAYKYFAYDNPTLTKNIYRVLVGAHVFEATVCVITAMMKGVTNIPTLIMWILQTLINGWFSLRLIIAYNPKPKRK